MHIQAAENGQIAQINKSILKNECEWQSTGVIFDSYILRREEMTVDFNVLKDLLQTWQQALLISAVMQQHPASILHQIFSFMSFLGEGVNIKSIGREYTNKWSKWGAGICLLFLWLSSRGKWVLFCQYEIKVLNFRDEAYNCSIMLKTFCIDLHWNKDLKCINMAWTSVVKYNGCPL